MINPHKSINLPDSLDWRTKGVISPVKNQGIVAEGEAIAVVGLYL